jgi:hypothetical protein
MAYFYIADRFLQPHSPGKAILAGLAILFNVCVILQYPCGYRCDIQVIQAANGINFDDDALVNLVESIDHFLMRVGIYTRIPPTPEMHEMVFNIIVEILSTLALVTKELRQGRSSESLLSDATP